MYYLETLPSGRRSEDKVFVFGSNLAGIHGAGAALCAKRYYGAEQGRGRGFVGRSYAIPTKGWDIYTSLSLDQIHDNVRTFIGFAHLCLTEGHPCWFRITAIGCGRAKYTPDQIAPFFRVVPDNCYWPEEWEQVLRKLGAGLDPSRFIRRIAG